MFKLLKLLCIVLTVGMCCGRVIAFENIKYTCKKPGMLVLTFDDGISKNTNLLLDILDTEKVKATFFVIGETLKDSHKLATLKKVYERGHSIGNHTWSHPDLNRLDTKDIDREILDTQNGIDGMMKVKSTKYIRPPFGKIDSRVYAEIMDLGYTIVMWNLDFKDWNLKRSKKKMWAIYEKAISRANPSKDSFILVQHDRRIDSVWMVPDIIRLAREKGFKIVGLEECLSGVGGDSNLRLRAHQTRALTN